MKRVISPVRNVREQILKSAIQLLSKYGIKKLAQPQIAKRAGIPQGHMTYYFPTRSALLMAVAERSLQSIGEFLLKKASKSIPLKPEETLPLVIPLMKDKNRTRMIVGLLVESDENPELRKKLKEQLNFSFDLIALAMTKEKTSAEVRLMNAALLGLSLQYYLNNEKQKDTLDLTDQQIDDCLNTLSKKLLEDQ